MVFGTFVRWEAKIMFCSVFMMLCDSIVLYPVSAKTTRYIPDPVYFPNTSA